MNQLRLTHNEVHMIRPVMQRYQMLGGMLDSLDSLDSLRCNSGALSSNLLDQLPKSEFKKAELP